MLLTFILFGMVRYSCLQPCRQIIDLNSLQNWNIFHVGIVMDSCSILILFKAVISGIPIFVPGILLTTILELSLFVTKCSFINIDVNPVWNFHGFCGKG